MGLLLPCKVRAATPPRGRGVYAGVSKGRTRLSATGAFSRAPFRLCDAYGPNLGSQVRRANSSRLSPALGWGSWLACEVRPLIIKLPSLSLTPLPGVWWAVQLLTSGYRGV